MKGLAGFAMLACVTGAVLLLVGCQSNPPEQGPGPSSVEVDFYYHPAKPPTQRFVKIDGHPTVLQVTRRAAEVGTQVTPTGDEWVVRVGKYAGNTRVGTMWKYELNNDIPKGAPNLVHVSAGDIIRWRLE
jgi:hypothetical protein